MRNFSAALLAALLLAGCTMPYRPPRFVEADATFPGLIDFTARAPGKTTDVLLVHGMCTHDATWAKEAVATLAAQLAANVKPAPVAAQPLRSAAPAIEIVPIEIATPHGAVKFKSLIWSPLTTPIKQQLCYDQTDKSPICTGTPPFPHARASLNAKVKDRLLDDCLPDALIYQGAGREQIQMQMREAVLAATAGADPDTPLVVISASLGSKILFDTLVRMMDEPADSRAAQVAARNVQRMAWLIMAANQIPLLQMAEQPIAAEAVGVPGGKDARQTSMQAAPPDSLQRLLEKRRPPATDRRTMVPLTLVAFSDPNDVLSYTLLPERYQGEVAGVFNVLVSNAPTYFGLLEDPVRAHQDYLSNSDVGSLIACGRPRSTLCK